LAKTKCSSDIDFLDFRNEITTVNKNLIEEDDEVIMLNSGYNSKISFMSMNKAKNLNKTQNIKDKAISILNKFIGKE